jgi:hypothetical protein
MKKIIVMKLKIQQIVFLKNNLIGSLRKSNIFMSGRYRN